MVQDVYLVAVKCKNCGVRHVMKYEYPARTISNFGDYCGCGNPQPLIISDTAFSPKEWYTHMEKRGLRA